MPDCVWIWHFLIGTEGTIGRAVRNQHLLLELFYGNGLLLGFGFSGFWVVSLWFVSCPMKFMNQWHALSFRLFCIISLV